MNLLNNEFLLKMRCILKMKKKKIIIECEYWKNFNWF